MKNMRIKNILCMLMILFVVILFSDTITLKNGIKIDGALLSVTADSITIMTSGGKVSIAVIEVEKIETNVSQTVPEMTVNVKEEGIPRSIRQVGYGCLGGIVGLTASSLIAVNTDNGCGGGAGTMSLILGSIILGIVFGVTLGGAN